MAITARPSAADGFSVYAQLIYDSKRPAANVTAAAAPPLRPMANPDRAAPVRFRSERMHSPFSPVAAAGSSTHVALFPSHRGPAVFEFVPPYSALNLVAQSSHRVADAIAASISGTSIASLHSDGAVYVWTIPSRAINDAGELQPQDFAPVVAIPALDKGGTSSLSTRPVRKADSDPRLYFYNTNAEEVRRGVAADLAVTSTQKIVSAWLSAPPRDRTLSFEPLSDLQAIVDLDDRGVGGLLVALSPGRTVFNTPTSALVGLRSGVIVKVNLMAVDKDVLWPWPLPTPNVPPREFFVHHRSTPSPAPS